MAISGTDLKQYQAEHMPTDDSSASGGDVSATEVTAATIGEWLPSKAAAASGGSTRYQYQKSFIKNTHATDSLTSGKVYLENGLIDPAANGTATVQITDSTDATDTTIRLIGRDTSQAPQTEDIAVDAAVTEVTGSKSWYGGAGGIIGALVLTTSTGALKELANTYCTIKRSATLGIIPVGCHSAVGFVDIGVVGTLNDTGEATNRITTPAGISFSRPVIEGNALSFADTLGAGDKQGVWAKETLYAGMTNMSDFEVVLKVTGESA